VRVSSFAEKAALPQFSAGALEAAVQSILSVTSGNFEVPDELSVKSVTDGVLLDAWVVLNCAAEASLDTFTGVTLKQKFAWLLAAAAVGKDGPLCLSAEQALLSGKSLHKQVEKVQKDLSGVSSKAERACSAAAKAAAGDAGLQAVPPSVLAHILQTKQADVASIKGRTSITATNFMKLLQVEPKPEASQVVMPDPEVAAQELSPDEKFWQDFNEEQATKGELQFSANRGIPRSLARELGEEGCAAVENYFKTFGGVGVPMLGPDGPFVLATSENAHLVTTLCMGGELVSLTWEQALRHKLPAVLQHVAHVASETRFALDEFKDVIPQLQRAVKETTERNKQLERQLELRCTCGQLAEDSD